MDVRVFVSLSKHVSKMELGSLGCDDPVSCQTRARDVFYGTSKVYKGKYQQI